MLEKPASRQWQDWGPVHQENIKNLPGTQGEQNMNEIDMKRLQIKRKQLSNQLSVNGGFHPRTNASNSARGMGLAKQ